MIRKKKTRQMYVKPKVGGGIVVDERECGLTSCEMKMSDCFFELQLFEKGMMFHESDRH